MSWEVAGSIGEIIGALAVVISVIYLSVQIRKQTQESRLAAKREMSSQYSDFLAAVADTREMATVYLQAVKDYEALPSEERIMVSMLFHRGFRVLEQQFLHTSSGNVDASYFESVNRAFDEWFTLPGVRRWWDLSKHMFDDRFQTHIGEVMSLSSEGSYHSTFSKDRTNAT